MAAQTATLPTTRRHKQYKPGHLLAPFDWAAEQVAIMAQAEPLLLAHLFELDRKRMHLIALVLAHRDEPPSPELARLLGRASARDVLDSTLAHRPAGLVGALECLPQQVLAPQGYHRLVALLHEPRAAKLLFHMCSIDEEDVSGLYALPVRLRNPVVLGAFDWLDGMDGLEEGLRLLVARGAVPSFEALQIDLASAGKPAELTAKVRRLLDTLPLPDALPPVAIGAARRLDRAEELRALAKRWHNCLANFVEEVDRGQCAIYLWNEARARALCLVERRGRLGWFLKTAKGPRNADLPPELARRVLGAFAEAGVPSSEAAAAIECLLVEEEPSARALPHARARRR